MLFHYREGQSEEEEWQLDQIIWTILFSFILVVAMLGNSIVIWIILGKIPECDAYYHVTMVTLSRYHD
jgi:hypothetical protein